MLFQQSIKENNMDKLKIELENCYGIKKMNYEFDFSKKSTYAIYAPNGVMKTSFAKTFLDLIENKQSADAIFPDRITKRNITNAAGTNINGENVFVVLPYKQDFKSEKISTLLVNKILKEKYEKIHANIDEKKEILLNELRNNSGIKKGVEEIISQDFIHTTKDFFKAIQRIKSEVTDKDEPLYSDIQYNKIFNDKTITFLETKDFKNSLADYIAKYNELIESSTYFKKGIFNHNNATTIAKNLKDNGFFKAKHTVSLNSGGEQKIISTEAELEKIIQEEKDIILKNPDLLSKFDEIDKKITANQDLKAFRDYIEINTIILPELVNINSFKQKLWISYFKVHKELYGLLEKEFADGQNEIEKIVEQAKEEKTQWLSVLEEFNKRFFVPFKLTVDNQEDVILKSELPRIKFIFDDGKGTANVEEGDLFKVLSNGELRALYLLNIIFEVEARKSASQPTVFVVDDIADSFDYKNKYAIIEYLKDISKESIFKQIILTHNFDFYRTVCSRLEMSRQNKLNTVRGVNGVFLNEEKYQKNPFSHWKENFHLTGNEAMLIASLPFVRNLAEYTGDNVNFDKLTTLLHIKEDTKNVTTTNLQTIFVNVLKDKTSLTLPNPTKNVLNLIYEVADSIFASTSESIDLENKIVLAIAIRLKAEEYMIRKINDDTFWKAIKEFQTAVLIDKYKTIFPSEAETIALLEQVNLMTPENIHINSFMYEPILDMSNEHLKSLYNAIKTLI